MYRIGDRRLNPVRKKTDRDIAIRFRCARAIQCNADSLVATHLVDEHVHKHRHVLHIEGAIADDVCARTVTS